MTLDIKDDLNSAIECKMPYSKGSSLELCRGEYEWLSPIMPFMPLKSTRKQERAMDAPPQDIQPTPGSTDEVVTTGDT